MQTAKVTALKQKRRKALEQLAGMSEWMTGSLVETERGQGKRKRPFRYLSRSIRGRNRITYVAANQLRRFGECLVAGQRAKALFGEIAELSVAIVKAETKKGRQR